MPVPTPEPLVERPCEPEVLAGGPGLRVGGARPVFENDRMENGDAPGRTGATRWKASFLPFAVVAAGEFAARMGEVPPSMSAFA
ncbi:MAG: hypothetical protein BGO98_03435 [Myxococcales bacterium 68-20]|nr:MAG: hypothetical protein BGO98_03435 [Myxococcales bacterium 68-20]